MVFRASTPFLFKFHYFTGQVLVPGFTYITKFESNHTHSCGAQTGGNRRVDVVPELSRALLPLSLWLTERMAWICSTQKLGNEAWLRLLLLQSIIFLHALFDQLRDSHMQMSSFIFKRNVWAGDTDLGSLLHIRDGWSRVWRRQKQWKV